MAIYPQRGRAGTPGRPGTDQPTNTLPYATPQTPRRRRWGWPWVLLAGCYLAFILVLIMLLAGLCVGKYRTAREQEAAWQQQVAEARAAAQIRASVATQPAGEHLPQTTTATRPTTRPTTRPGDEREG